MNKTVRITSASSVKVFSSISWQWTSNSAQPLHHLCRRFHLSANGLPILSNHSVTQRLNSHCDDHRVKDCIFSEAAYSLFISLTCRLATPGPSNSLTQKTKLQVYPYPFMGPLVQTGYSTSPLTPQEGHDAVLRRRRLLLVARKICGIKHRRKCIYLQVNTISDFKSAQPSTVDAVCIYDIQCVLGGK